MSKIERSDRLKQPPIVGQYYSVPTVLSAWCGIERYWPVMGRRHEDKDYLQFPHVHYHVDCRFVPAKVFSAVHRYDGRPPYMAFAASVIQIRSYTHRDYSIEWRRVRCYRASHSYPLNAALSSPAFLNLYHAFAGAKCRRNATGFVCPHKQFALGSIAPIDGVITCPLHGLRIDAMTGAVLGVAA